MAARKKAQLGVKLGLSEQPMVVLVTLQPKDVHDPIVGVEEHDSSAQHHAGPIPRKLRQTGDTLVGQGLHAALQAWRQGSVALQLAL